MAYLEDGGINGSLFSTVDTGRTLPNGVPERKEYFDGGFQGYGFKIWKDENGKYKIEADDLTIRNSFTIFELIVSQIRAVKGSMAITQGSAKVKSVSIIDANYVIEIEDDINTIVEHDYIRCQKGNKAYHVEVESVNQNYIMVPLSEFDSDTDGIITNPPEAGDEIVQFGNASRLEEYKNRHSAIYLSIDNNEPAIDLMTDIYTKNWDTSLKVRIGGNLPGTDGDRGFYSVNGKIIAVDEEGESIYEINPDGSGFFARGKFSWTASGSPTFSGTILLKTTNGGVWEVNEEGDNTIGDPNGKHIFISPHNSSMSFFDEENNVVAIFNGEKITNTDNFFSSESPTIKIKNLPHTITSSTSIPRTRVVISDVFKTDGTVSIISSFSASADVSKVTKDVFMNVGFYVETYSDEGLNTLLTSTKINGNALSVQFPDITDFKKDSILNTPGFNVIVMEIWSLGVFNASHSITVKSFVAELNLNSYISNYFANGLILGTSKNNYFSVSNNNIENLPSIQMHAENAQYGFYFTKFGFFLKQKGYWGMPSDVICRGKVKLTSSGASFAACSTYDNYIPFIRRIALGMCEIIPHDRWVKDLVNGDTCYMTLTSIYSSSVVAQLTKWETKSITINLGKPDGGFVDTDFYIEIKRI